MRYVPLLVALICSISTSAPLSAATIFNNGAPFIGLAANATFADSSGPSGFSEVADDFSLASGASTVRDVHWWGIYDSGVTPSSDQFTLKIYNDNSNAPGSLVLTLTIDSLSRTATSDVVTGRTVHAYHAAVPGVSLAPSTTYWLGISNNSGGNAWAWVQSNPFSGNLHQFSISNGSFGRRLDEAAFFLTDTIVPEPSTAALALVGGLALLGMAWKRRRVTNGN